MLDLDIPVRLEPGENLVKVVAFNGLAETGVTGRFMVPPAQQTQQDPQVLPRLWILAVGVNVYQDHELPSLSYAEADAEALVEALTTQQGKLFREVHSLRLTDQASLKPTHDNILYNLPYLAQAGEEDVLLIFLAGHGLTNEQGEFSFLPSDAVVQHGGTLRSSRTVPWRSLATVLDLPARKLFFTDTCHLEGLRGNKDSAVDNDRLVKDLQEFNAAIITACHLREISREDERAGHGLFTFSLLKGLSGAADLNGDRSITITELASYLSEALPLLTNGAQYPTTYIPSGYATLRVTALE
jgi:uncharacterized caspase-like protein